MDYLQNSSYKAKHCRKWSNNYSTNRESLQVCSKRAIIATYGSYDGSRINPIIEDLPPKLLQQYDVAWVGVSKLFEPFVTKNCWI